MEEHINIISNNHLVIAAFALLLLVFGLLIAAIISVNELRKQSNKIDREIEDMQRKMSIQERSQF